MVSSVSHIFVGGWVWLANAIHHSHYAVSLVCETTNQIVEVLKFPNLTENVGKLKIPS